ncbi:hypothetical protein SAY87_011993 [Trapa incisa]|uniref:Coenzyme Q-binding protein COQ10 START domain-containing protein n=1 Tax=Trapa incisa TaxID=236973 RepID=A0AAN7GK48_9MYRT|nr:hypothetical protein SAY87_011993 [Trapa incisa]
MSRSDVAGIRRSFGIRQSSPHKDAGILSGCLWNANISRRRQFLGCRDGFPPVVSASEILRSYPDGSLDAELDIGFNFLVESYISHVEMKKPRYVKSTAWDSTLFEHQINVWEFSPGPSPGSCELQFLVDFKFQSPLYSQKNGLDDVIYIVDLKKGQLMKGLIQHVTCL